MKLISQFTFSALAAVALLAQPSATVAGGVAVPPVTADVKTGSTTLSLSDSFSGALDLASIKYVKVIPGRTNPGKDTITFPVVGGAVDLVTGKGEVIHSGGVNFTAGSKKVSVTDFVITTAGVTDQTPIADVSALVTVNGVLAGRVVLFNIPANAVSAPVTLPKNKVLTLSGVELKLTAEGAAALNNAFGVNFLTTDTVVGSATVKAITVKGSL